MRGVVWMIFVLLIFSRDAVAAPAQWAYRISFTDKSGSPALSNPNVFLSTRALQRRSQQGIAVLDADRPVSPAYLDSVLRLGNGKMHNTSRWFNQCVILVTDTAGIAAIRNRPFVTAVRLVGYFAGGLHKGMSGQGKNEVPLSPAPPANKGTGTSAYYGTTWGQTTMVNGDYLHDNGLKGTGQLIAVLDLGFNGVDTHPGFDSLRQQGRIVDAYNFISDNTDIYSLLWSHGTSSFSTIAGLIPGTFVGSAPYAQYALYITDDNNYTDAVYELDNFVAGLERADSIGADIVTTSLGYNTFDNPAPGIYDFTKPELDGHTTLVARAINMAVARGIFAVNSAGNEATTGWNFLLTPGDADSVLTVGAVKVDGSIANFSSPGPNSSGRIKPDVCLQGDPAAVFTSNSITGSSGTSFSTPQLAGWAACIRQANPTITPYALRSAIIRSADRTANPDAPGGYGYGIPDFKKVLQYVGVDEIPATDAAIVVSPNPFKDKIVLEIKATKPLAIGVKLYDMSGRMVAGQNYKVQSGQQQMSMAITPKLPAGNYILQAICNGRLSSFKLSRL